MNVCEYIVSVLEKNNVSHVFGYQGGAVVKLIDEVFKCDRIKYIHCYHEQAAAFAADAYARVTGNIGVAIATSGPGATNLITGIANAHLDSIPTLFITGQEFSSRIKSSDEIRTNGFQDVNIVKMVEPITKYAKTILRANEIATELQKALKIARSGRPGAVLLDIPIDIQLDNVEAVQPGSGNEITLNIEPSGAASMVESVANTLAILRSAQRPMILAGGGVRLSGSMAELSKLATVSGIPVATTLNGIDSCDEKLGFSGLYGNEVVCRAVYHADVLLVLGARLGQQQVGKSKNEYTRAKIIHVDVDPIELSRIIEEEISICGDLKDFLIQLLAVVQDKPLPSYADWHHMIDLWKARAGHQAPATERGVSPIGFLQELNRHFAPNAIVTVDVGKNQMWAAQAFQFSKGQRFICSSGLGSMGYALPAAIAAKLAHPALPVIAIIGDGGFQMNIQELQCVKSNALNIVIVILNNNSLGMIKTTQDRHFSSRNNGTSYPDYSCVDIEKIASAYSIGYVRIASEKDFSVLGEVVNNSAPVIVEVDVDACAPLKTRYDISDLQEV